MNTDVKSAIFVLVATVVFGASSPSYGVQAEMGGGASGALGGYGFSAEWSVGSDTSSDGSIGYEITFSFGKTDGGGFDLSLLDVGVGTGTYGSEAGVGAYGTYSLGKDVKFQGRINADGSLDGVISTSKPLPNGTSAKLELEIKRQADGQLQVKPKAGIGLSSGDFAFKGGVLTYTFKGTLLSPNDTGAKKVVYDVWTAPGYAVAQTQILISDLLWGNKDLEKSDKALIEHLVKEGINEEGLEAIKKWLALDKEDRVKNMIQVKREWFSGATCTAKTSPFDEEPGGGDNNPGDAGDGERRPSVGLTPFKTY